MILTLTAAPLIAELTALGYTGAQTAAFFSGFSNAISTYLISNAVIALDTDGTVPHTHIVPGPTAFTTFGSPTVLKAAMLSAVPVTGSGVDPVFDAFSKGIIDFLTAHARLATGVGPTHTHALQV